jgi:hypothetical protein
MWPRLSAVAERHFLFYFINLGHLRAHQRHGS